MKKWFKLVCPNNKDTPPYCSIIAGMPLPEGEEKYMPPHGDGCLCTIEPTERPAFCDPVLITMEPGGIPLHHLLRDRCIQVPLVIHSPDNQSPDTKERIAKQISGSDIPDFDFSGFCFPKVMQNIAPHHKDFVERLDNQIEYDLPMRPVFTEELPSFGCSSCLECDQTLVRFRGKIGCNNSECKKYSMVHIREFYEEQLKKTSTSLHPPIKPEDIKD